MRARLFHPPPALTLVLTLVLHLAPRTNAAPLHQQLRDENQAQAQTAEQTLKPLTTNSRGCANRAADVARAATKTCGTLPVAEALRSVAMTAAAARWASEVLAALGFDTALDLELLGGGDAAAELFAELKTGGLGVADRARGHTHDSLFWSLSDGRDNPGDNRLKDH